jgi:hypothetical protein
MLTGGANEAMSRTTVFATTGIDWSIGVPVFWDEGERCVNVEKHVPEINQLGGEPVPRTLRLQSRTGGLHDSISAAVLSHNLPTELFLLFCFLFQNNAAAEERR